jgi:hypothetical protein
MERAQKAPGQTDRHMRSWFWIYQLGTVRCWYMAMENSSARAAGWLGRKMINLLLVHKVKNSRMECEPAAPFYAHSRNAMM